MPNQSPVSRYLLVAFAVLMLGSALPDAEVLLQRLRQLNQPRRVGMVERVVAVQPLEYR